MHLFKLAKYLCPSQSEGPDSQSVQQLTFTLGIYFSQLKLEYMTYFGTQKKLIILFIGKKILNIK